MLSWAKKLNHWVIKAHSSTHIEVSAKRLNQLINGLIMNTAHIGKLLLYHPMECFGSSKSLQYVRKAVSHSGPLQVNAGAKGGFVRLGDRKQLSVIMNFTAPALPNASDC